MASETLLISVTVLVAVGILAATGLTAWQGWLQLKLRELDRHHAEPEAGSGAGRIEMADVKERRRKLEAIAAGVDL